MLRLCGADRVPSESLYDHNTVDAENMRTFPAAPSVPVLRASWPVLDGTWGSEKITFLRWVAGFGKALATNHKELAV